MDSIHSLQNQRIKDVVKLRERRARKRQGRSLIDGAREIHRALQCGVRPVEVFVCPSLAQSNDALRVLDRLEKLGLETIEVTEPVFDKIAFGDRSEGVLAVFEPNQPALSDLQLDDNSLVVVLDGVEKPGNVGAMLRSADGAGVSAVVLADASAELFNPNTIRASLGCVFRVPTACASAAETLAWLTERGLQLVLATPDATLDYTAVDYTRPTAIVLGSEAEGLTPEFDALVRAAPPMPAVQAVRLPMRGIADSLNVSATAAILAYEALRQRTAAGLVKSTR